MNLFGTVDAHARFRRVRDEYARVQRQLELLAQRFERLKAARLDPVRHELEALEIQLGGMERLLGDLRPRAAAVSRGIGEWHAACGPRPTGRAVPGGNGDHANLENQITLLREDLRRWTAQLQATSKRADRLPRLFRRLAEGLLFAVRDMDGAQERDH